MKTEPGLLKKYDLLLFFLLAYLLSWWSVPFANGAILPYGPALAALIIIALTMGRQGLAEWWGRLSQWRAGWWYLIGPAIIVAYLLVAYGISALLGAQPSRAPGFPPTMVFVELLMLGGQWEEIGWSGYALPELQKRFGDRPNGTLIASLILGAGRAIWHLPLFLSGAVAWHDIFIFSFAFQIIITWIYNRSKGSVPAIMVFHYASNVLAGGIMLSAFSGAARETFYALFVACACVIALAIVLMTRGKLGRTAS
jgi:hypothetical protein